MRYDFDKVLDRRGTNCIKYDFTAENSMPEDIIPLWVADMDWQAPDEVRERLIEMAEHGIYGYSGGKESYFRAVAGWMEDSHGWKVEKDWMVSAPGVVFAIAAAIRAFTEKGDSVMIQRPVYYPFGKMIEENGRVIADNTLCRENGRYTMDFEDMERQIADSNVRLFILCNPHNPVGRVWREDELRRLGEVCLKYGVLIVSDEIHHDFIFPGHRHVVLADLDERFRDITVTCTAPSKTFNIAGLQASNIFIANPRMREAFRKEISKTGYDGLNMMALGACESAYRCGRDWLEELLVYLKGNLDFAREFLDRRVPGVKLVEPEGTYLLWLDCRELGLEHDELEDLMVHKAGLWLDGGQMFGEAGAGFQRVNMACPRAILEAAFEKLAAAVEGLKDRRHT